MTRYLLLVALTLAVACGDTEGKSGDGTNNANNVNNVNNVNNANNANNSDYDPGVALDTPSNELGEEDRARICQELGALTDELGLAAASCLSNGVGAAEVAEPFDEENIRAVCNQSYDLCINSLLGRPAGGNFCSPASNCTGTVEQGIACVLDAAEGMISVIEPFPACDDLTVEALPLTPSLQLPPSPPCAQFNATCE